VAASVGVGAGCLSEGNVLANTLSLRLLQDKRQVDLIVKCAGESPGDTEIASCTLRIVIARNAIVAVLKGQDVDPTFGSNQVGEKINRPDIPFLIIRDRGAPPPPLCLVIAPHLQDGPRHLHIRIGRGECELAPIQVSCLAPRFLVAILIPQTNGPAFAIAGQDIPTGSVPVIPPHL
jgi:hypothetical protein